MSAPTPSDLDYSQVLQGSYDESQGRLRVDAVVTATIADVIIHASESDIAIADQVSGNLLKINNDGSLDANVVLDHTSDSVTAYQGTNPWIVTSDSQGSVNFSRTTPIPAAAIQIAGTDNTNLQPLLTDSLGKLFVNAIQTGNWDIRTITNPVSVTQDTSPWLTSRNWVLDSVTDSVSVSNFPSSLSVTQGTTPWLVDGSAHTQPISAVSLPLPTGAATETTLSSFKTANHTDLVAINTTLNSPMQNSGGSVTALQGTSPWVVSGTITTSPNVNVHDGSGTSISSTGSSLNVDVTNIVPVSQSGSWSVTAVQPTAANLNATVVGTGTFAVQASQSGTWNIGTVTTITNPVAVTQSTSPWVVSGTVTANAGTGNFTVVQATAANLNATVTGTIAATQSGTWNINNVSGTVSLPTGASTEATLAKLTLTQGSTTSGQSGTLIQGAVTTTAPTYSTAQTNPLSLTTGGALRVDGSASTQPISGTVIANQGGAPWSVSGTGNFTVVQATAANLNATVTGTVAATQSGGWTVTANAGTNLNTSLLALESGGNLATIVTNTNNLSLSQASSTSGQKGNLILGATTTAAPTYVTAQSNPLSLTTTGALRTDSSATTQPISGTVTANQGGAPWSVSGSGNFTVVQPTAANLNTTVTGTVAATQSGTWNINNISGTISLPTGASTSANQTTGNTSLASIDTKIPSNLTVSSTRLLVDGSGVTQPVSGTVAATQSGTWTVQTIPSASTKSTYAVGTNFTVAATPTDIFTITGSGTKTIKVVNIGISGTNTGNTNVFITVIKRSTANSGGASSTLTNVPFDSTNAAATATVRSYTVNPTLGTAVGTMRSDSVFFPTLASTNQGTTIDHDFGNINDEGITLRGTSEVLSVNLSGVLITGTTTVSIDITWTEE